MQESSVGAMRSMSRAMSSICFADELLERRRRAFAALAVEAEGDEAGRALVDVFENRVADADLVAVREAMLGDVATVDDGAVAAREIAQDPVVAFEEHARVVAAHGLVGDADRARRVAADDDLAREERVGRGELLEARRVEQDEPGARVLLEAARGLRRFAFVRRRDAGPESAHELGC